jgi:hypothetical protein
MSDIGDKIMAVIAAVIAVAVVALIVSQGATTVSVIASFFSGLSGLIATAVSPVTGSGAGSGVFSGTNLGSGLTGQIIGLGNTSAYGTYGSGGLGFFTGANGTGVNLSGLPSLVNSGANLVNAFNSGSGSSSGAGFVDSADSTF